MWLSSCQWHSSAIEVRISFLETIIKVSKGLAFSVGLWKFLPRELKIFEHEFFLLLNLFYSQMLLVGRMTSLTHPLWKHNQTVQLITVNTRVTSGLHFLGNPGLHRDFVVIGMTGK